MLLAGGFALAELIAGLTIGQFVARDRAEIAIFLAMRPWLLLSLPAIVARWPHRVRGMAYAGTLVLAAAGEALLVAPLGGANLVRDAVRGIVAGAALVLVLDGLMRFALAVEPRFGRSLGLLLGLGLLVVPGPLRLYERIALAPVPGRVAGARPALAVLTGLPLAWGEGDAVIGARPNATYTRLSDEFAVRPIDVATPAALAPTRLLLAAQPRRLTPDEVIAIDGWVRGGGRALILADADLRWPSDLPAGDPRRPPRTLALAPLLARWGVRVVRDRPGIATVDFGPRRIVVDGIGRVVAPRCRPLAGGAAAECAIGQGRALILADADLLDDRLWVAAGPDGAGRLRRGGDNALLLAEQLDRLAGNRRDRSHDSAYWRRNEITPLVLLGGALPAMLCVLLAIFFRLWRSRG